VIAAVVYFGVLGLGLHRFDKKKEEKKWSTSFSPAVLAHLG
jgi:hypothetical protein